MKPPYCRLTHLLKGLSNSIKGFDLTSGLSSMAGAFYKALSCEKRVQPFDISNFDIANPDI